MSYKENHPYQWSLCFLINILDINYLEVGRYKEAVNCQILRKCLDFNYLNIINVYYKNYSVLFRSRKRNESYLAKNVIYFSLKVYIYTMY